MIRAAVFLSAVAIAFGQDCSSPTCYKCQQTAGCGWYTAAGLSNCYANTTVPSGLNFTLTTTCPACQAGNCLDCQNTPGGGCAWYSNSIGAFGGKCDSNATVPPTPVGTYSLTAACPACTSYTTCSQCTANENVTCGWYSLAGVDKCAEASPGYLWSKTTNAFCSGNICASSANCTNCQALNNATANVTNCNWYVPATAFLATLYNPKCDIAGNGVVDRTLYDVATTCPPCQATSCTACKADATCSWVAVNFAGQSVFGQCVQNGVSVNGKGVVGTCPAACQLYSCNQCIAASGCTWYKVPSAASSFSDDTCDRSGNSFLHAADTPITAAGGTCPTCRETRCYECNQAAGCQWYAATAFGKIVLGTSRCSTKGNPPSIAPTAIATDDSKCEGNPNTATIALPGLALLAAFFV